MSWIEVPAEAAGMDRGYVEAAVRCAGQRLARRGAAGQLVVLRRGQVVLDRVFGPDVDRRSLFLVHSCSKPFVALLAHLLVERGQLSLDEPIAGRWPRFGRHGKQAITARQVLTHRAGVPDHRGLLVTAPSWRASVWRMEELRPTWPPGEVTAYHALTYGWILGELVRRAGGVGAAALLREALLEPLELEDTFMGLPDRHRGRAVPVVAAGGRRELAAAPLLNRRGYRRAVVPAAGISSTARDMARSFEMLRCGGELEGTRVLARDTVAEARRPAQDRPEPDRVLGRPTRWTPGFHLGGPTSGQDLARFMGELSGPETFGCVGMGCCTAWADPERELSVAYLTSLLTPAGAGIDHHGLVADCILRACG